MPGPSACSDDAAAAAHQKGGVIFDGGHHGGELGEIDAAVGVGDGQDVGGGGLQPGVDGGAVPGSGFVDDVGAQCPGNIGAAVARPVVHHDRTVVGWQSS